MRLIPMREDKDLPSKGVLQQVAGSSPTKAITPAEMRHRVRILDALERANGELRLEDAEWNVLQVAVRDFPWSVANPKLLQIIDDVLEAKEPPKE